MASTPPPFESNYSPPARKGTSPWVWIIVAIVGVCCVAVIGIGFMMNSLFTAGGSMVGCMVTAETANESLLEYAKDHGDKLPDGPNWQSDIAPYYNKRVAEAKKEIGADYLWNKFKPSAIEGNLECRAGTPVTGFALNKAIAGKKLSEIPDKSKTISIFETPEIGKNQVMEFTPRPKDSGPSMMGDKRGWMVWKLEGMPSPLNNQKGDPFNYEESMSEEAAPDAPKTEPKPATTL